MNSSTILRQKLWQGACYDSKANKLSQGNEEDRRDAAELRDIAAKIDHGKYYPML